MSTGIVRSWYLSCQQISSDSLNLEAIVCPTATVKGSIPAPDKRDMTPTDAVTVDLASDTQSTCPWSVNGCWKPEYRVLANSVNRVNERVSVPAQMVLPVRCLYRYERYERIPKPLPIPASYSCHDGAVGIATGALAR